jgi:ribose transport system permease protein
VLVVVALAVVLPLIVGEFDLSVGAVLGLAAITAAVLNVNAGAPVGISALAGLAVGPIVGAVNAFFIVVVGVDGLITTLGIGTLATGIGYAISNYVIVSGVDHPLVAAISTNVLGLPLSFYYGILLALAMWFVLKYTPVGQHLVFVGRAREVARLSGLRVNRIRLGREVATPTPTERAVELWRSFENHSRSQGARKIRRIARERFPADAPGRGGEWHFTPHQVATIRARIMATSAR